jgi:hypothetical protein
MNKRKEVRKGRAVGEAVGIANASASKQPKLEHSIADKVK